MDASRWQQVCALFDAALEQPPAARAAFLDAATDDPTLHAEVGSLLAAHAAADADGMLESSLLEAADLPAGARIGPYALVRLLGRGGMGAVYLADRADGQFRQRVALKLVEEPGGGALVARLLAERRILARLEHPHIARLLGGGISEPPEPHAPRLPYLVMEYVDGLPLTTYCTQQGLSLAGRLRLFRQVCAAVHYAHQNLVVHRDLKPSNILVTEGGGPDGGPTVKLLDFGIAKVLARSDDDEAAPLTRTGMLMLTPQYAAPEQLRGEPITTACDVYALGVVLYELLAGRPPYRLHGLSAGEMELVVGQAEPSRPSQAVAEADPAAPDALPATRPALLARQLRGDLDTIVLKALRKEPERRYASAEALADDVRRYLEGLPVEARPDALAYRAGKFVQRHRVGVAAAVLILLTLGAGIVATTVQARRAAAAASRAAALNAFLLQMLASADPDEAGRAVTVAELLDGAAAQVDTGFSDQPDLEAAVRLTLGRTYTALGLYDQGHGQLRRALALRERRHGPRHLDVAEAQAALAAVLRHQGAYAPADSLLKRALATTRARLGPRHALTAARLSDLGVVQWEAGDYAAAEPLLREALALEERLRGPDHEAVAASLGNLATLLADQGQKEEAERLYRRELALLERHLGPEHRRVAAALTHLGILRHDAGALAEADSLHRRALALYRRLHGPDHPDVAYALNNLATVRTDLGDLDDAEALQREGLALYRRTFGEEHPNVGIQLNNLAFTLRRQGRLDEAADTYAEATTVWRASLGPTHPYLAYGLHNLGTVRLAQGRAREAEPLLREALAVRQAALAPGHVDTYVTQSVLGECLTRLGQVGEAEPLLMAAYAALREALGPEHARVQETAERLTALYERLGRPEAAARVLAQPAGASAGPPQGQ